MALFELSYKLMNSCGTSTPQEGSMNVMVIGLDDFVDIWHCMYFFADITALLKSGLYFISLSTLHFTKLISFLSEL